MSDTPDTTAGAAASATGESAQPVAAVDTSAPTSLNSVPAAPAENAAMATSSGAESGSTPKPADTESANLGESGASSASGTTAPSESAPSLAHTLLERWHREMSVVGRGLSAETERLLKETAAFFGL